MHTHTHLLLSWSVGHRLPARRDRLLVAWAGVAPDLDALTAIFGQDAYGLWHHVLTHGIVAAAVVAGLVFAAARRRVLAALAAFAAFHLHLLCDLVGSGAGWSLTYLYPFSRLPLHTSHGWELASWQNMAVTAVVLGFSIWTAVALGRTFAESFLPARADAAIATTLRQRIRGGTKS